VPTELTFEAFYTYKED